MLYEVITSIDFAAAKGVIYGIRFCCKDSVMDHEDILTETPSCAVIHHHAARAFA